MNFIENCAGNTEIYSISYIALKLNFMFMSVVCRCNLSHNLLHYIKGESATKQKECGINLGESKQYCNLAE